jgi:hypothetical protein
VIICQQLHYDLSSLFWNICQLSTPLRFLLVYWKQRIRNHQVTKMCVIQQLSSLLFSTSVQEALDHNKIRDRWFGARIVTKGEVKKKRYGLKKALERWDLQNNSLSVVVHLLSIGKTLWTARVLVSPFLATGLQGPSQSGFPSPYLFLVFILYYSALL